MAALVDSSVVIAGERGDLDFIDLLRAEGEEDFALSAVGASELLHGLHRARTPAQKGRREAFLDYILSLMPVLPFDMRVARVHATLWVELERAGTPVGERDLMIGATAIAAGYKIATRDRRSFRRIPGLEVIEL